MSLTSKADRITGYILAAIYALLIVEAFVGAMTIVVMEVLR